MQRFGKHAHLNLHMNWIRILLIVSISVIITACGQVKHAPKAGEYGEKLVNSFLLTPSEIQALNKAVVDPPKDTFKRPNVGISFQADAAQNPYRFVLVVKGSTLQAGETVLKWIGGVQSESSNGYHPEVFQSNDSHHYDANEPILLVVSSDPFSVSESNNGINYAVHAELMEASNLQFQSVEVQIWRGKGSQYNWTAYLKFLLILILAIFGIYRLISR
ncbi:hypothetical protein [Acinetobacter courvalinii]|uniref:hypothetical protein n=1 Tax=Acinetobacter courvalinii TaxID=280147 RepID=UPI0021CF9BA4|nr:hypothetical protein [Acinetobacter courvalinii]MCU4638502.1 hypothetical protein [Acinetobacter courvalinii]